MHLNFNFSIAKAFVCLFVISIGCSTPVARKPQSCLPHRVTKVDPGTVTTGGMLQSQRTLQLVPDRVLTLRQAILESGGLLETASSSNDVVTQSTAAEQSSGQTSATLPTVAPTPTSSPPSVPAPSPTAAEQQEASTLQALKTTFSKIDQINALFQIDPMGPRGRAVYRDPVGDTIQQYLQSVNDNIAFAGQKHNPSLDFIRIQGINKSLPELIDDLEFIIDSRKSNNPEFAAEALSEIRKLKNLKTAPPQQAPVSPKPTSINTPKVKRSVLIGLENRIHRSETVYVDPQLVFKTAVGDIPLKDGDFVFATRTEDTSLPRNIKLDHESLVPVLGVSEEYNAVDPNEYSEIASVINLQVEELRKQEAMISSEHIGILRRQVTGSIRPEVFYIPIPNATSVESSSQLGTVMPGDSFLFTVASRSPIVYDRLVGPLQADLIDQRRELQKKAECRQKLPFEGNYVKKASANWNYYTQPIVQSARNIVR